MPDKQRGTQKDNKTLGEWIMSHDKNKKRKNTKTKPLKTLKEKKQAKQDKKKQESIGEILNQWNS